MADYAGAVAAMRARFVAGWSETLVAYQNETPQGADGEAIEPWPPVKENPNRPGEFIPAPWCYFEVIASQSDIRGAGLPGDNIWLTKGHIFVNVYTPLGYGLPEPLRLAGAAGEIFRVATFYQDGTGSKVVCMAPNIDGGASDADNGNWFRVTCSIPFEFYFHK